MPIWRTAGKVISISETPISSASPQMAMRDSTRVCVWMRRACRLSATVTGCASTTAFAKPEMQLTASQVSAAISSSMVETLDVGHAGEVVRRTLPDEIERGQGQRPVCRPACGLGDARGGERMAQRTAHDALADAIRKLGEQQGDQRRAEHGQPFNEA